MCFKSLEHPGYFKHIQDISKWVSFSLTGDKQRDQCCCQDLCQEEERKIFVRKERDRLCWFPQRGTPWIERSFLKSKGLNKTPFDK